MATTTIPTFTAGQIVTAADCNTYWKDNIHGIWTWSTRSFSAGDYTGNGSMTWTVASGDVATFKYRRFGKTMIVNFDIGSSTVGGTPNTDLRIAIPESCVATHQVLVPCLVSDNTTAHSAGYCFVQVSGTVITVRKMDNSNWTASTDNTWMQGQIEFEIN